MVVAANGIPGLWLIVATLVGGTLAAGGANTFNMVIDRDIDAIMERTKKRPLVTGVMSPRAATVFAVVLEIVAFAVLAIWVNFLSAWLAMSATAFYVVVYTLWLKRRSKQNIVIGGAAGAVPVLDRLVRSDQLIDVDAGALVPGHLHLDPAALLGARGALPRRLRGGPRSHDAGRRVAAAHDARDPRSTRS